MNLYRFYILVVGLSPFILWGLVNSDPLATIANVRRLRRWLRQKGQESYGKHSANHILKDFRREEIKKGYPKAEVDDFIKRYRPRLIEREGKRIWDEKRGDKDDFDMFI